VLEPSNLLCSALFKNCLCIAVCHRDVVPWFSDVPATNTKVNLKTTNKQIRAKCMSDTYVLCTAVYTDKQTTIPWPLYTSTCIMYSWHPVKNWIILSAQFTAQIP